MTRYPPWGAGRRRAHWGDGLQACRRGAGLTQRALAAQTGLSVAYLKQLEAGVRPFAAGSIERILEAIGVTLADVQAARDALPVQIIRTAPPPWPWWAERRDASAMLRRADAAARRARYNAYMAAYMRARRRAGAGSGSTTRAPHASMGGAWPPSGSPTTSATP